MTEQPNTFRRFITVYLIAFALVVGIGVGAAMERRDIGSGRGQLVNTPTADQPPAFLSRDVDFGLFEQTWQTIRDHYIDQGGVNDSQLFYGALTGLVKSLGDDHSVFLDPQVNETFNDSLKGSFSGIGAEITIKNEQLQVVAPLPGTPAEQNGLRSGDYILKIDDAETTDMSLDYAVSLIRGDAGTTVTLSIYRPVTKELKDYVITRAKIDVKSVTWQMRDDGLAYIKIVDFHEDTVPLFRQAVAELLLKNPQGVILDLRGNPGGFFDGAIKVASEWISDGVIVSEGNGGTRREFTADGAARLADYPTIVLVDAGSASASEIVAGALRDRGKAQLVGAKTFGKGSVQELFDLPDGSAIKLTTARWFTPNGTSIDKEGITPDVAIERTIEDYDNDRDPQLDKAVELLRQ